LNKGGETVTTEGEFYACKNCGNVVQVIASGSGILVCCGKPMELVEED
jgi:superoxide reductase